MLKFFASNVEFFWGELAGSTRNWGGDMVCDIMFDWAITIVVHLCKFGKFSEESCIIVRGRVGGNG
jgi:hypothetical protein